MGEITRSLSLPQTDIWLQSVKPRGKPEGDTLDVRSSTSGALFIREDRCR